MEARVTVGERGRRPRPLRRIWQRQDHLRRAKKAKQDQGGTAVAQQKLQRVDQTPLVRELLGNTSDVVFEKQTRSKTPGEQKRFSPGQQVTARKYTPHNSVQQFSERLEPSREPTAGLASVEDIYLDSIPYLFVLFHHWACPRDGLPCSRCRPLLAAAGGGGRKRRNPLPGWFTSPCTPRSSRSPGGVVVTIAVVLVVAHDRPDDEKPPPLDYRRRQGCGHWARPT